MNTRDATVPPIIKTFLGRKQPQQVRPPTPPYIQARAQAFLLPDDAGSLHLCSLRLKDYATANFGQYLPCGRAYHTGVADDAQYRQDARSANPDTAYRPLQR